MKNILTLCFWVMACTLSAQFNANEAFEPLNFNNGNLFRSASGKPSKFYWQNQANYNIQAAFDTTTHVLNGIVKIDYINNSPDILNELWLELDQNIDKQNLDNTIITNDKGFDIKSVKEMVDGQWEDVKFNIYNTRMIIYQTAKALLPGKTAKLSIEYSYILQQHSRGGRSGYMNSKNGSIYEFSYWYPRMCVYDDLHGWNTLPFLGAGEMYLDYGNINYQLTLPAGMVVAGAGQLQNGKEILTKQTQQRLSEAANSDKRLFIRKVSELRIPVTQKKAGTVTWQFSMQNTRDVAWSASSAYIWDAAKINLPNHKKALAQSFYIVESLQDSSAWNRSTEFLKFAMEDYSNRWYAFPYTVASSVAGPVGGMEFPGFAFNSFKAKPYGMFLLVSHELGHTWFPMIVGSDERRYAWMDEGFNTFIDIFAHADFNNGEFAPKRDGEFSPGKNSIPADEIAKVIASLQNGPTMMMPPDAQSYKTVHPLSYFKSAFALVLLRNVILGKKRFDYAFRQYISNWAFKHPAPNDFFRTMENASGEDLDWFWRGWYFNNWQFDVAIAKVSSNGNITIQLKQKLPLPIPVLITEANGQKHYLQLPVEIWHYGDTYTFKVPVSSAVTSVILDPDKQLPDLDRSNNNWE